MLIADYLGYKEPVKGDVGLELEVEAKNQLPIDVKHPWVAKEEGSLRGHHMEYVTNGAIHLKDKRDNLRSLIDQLNPSKPNSDSIRTSFHVHCNVTHLTFSEMWTAACAYWLVDNMMVNYCGKEREGNAFCLRLKDAEAIAKICKGALEDPAKPCHRLGDNVRYSSQNISSVNQHGTLEYRAMRGTLDVSTLDEWSTACSILVNKAAVYGSPDKLMDEFFKDDERVLKHLLQSFYYTLTSQKKWKDSIDENIGTVCEIAYFHNWAKWEAAVDKMAGRKAKRTDRDVLEEMQRHGRNARVRAGQIHVNHVPAFGGGGGAGGPDPAHAPLGGWAEAWNNVVIDEGLE